jgi:hypothetical protein
MVDPDGRDVIVPEVPIVLSGGTVWAPYIDSLSATLIANSGVAFSHNPTAGNNLGVALALLTAGIAQRASELAPQYKPSPQDIAKAKMAKVADALNSVVDTQDIFTLSQLECMSGIETGRTWDPNSVSRNGRVGLFQFNEINWNYSGTGIPWNNGNSARNPGDAAAAALALLYRKLGINGLANPTQAALTTAIDNFGEADGKYGQAVMNCAKQLDAGNFAGAYKTMEDYSIWRADLVDRRKRGR